MTHETPFRLTYSTMFDPPEELHTQFAQAMDTLKQNLGQEISMLINGEERVVAEKHTERSPINTDLHLVTYQKGSTQDAQDAIAAARQAFPGWSRMYWDERVYLLRKAADLIDRRLFEISASLTLEVGKNRMEALGDVAETADLIRYACDQMEAHRGYRAKMGKDPLVGLDSSNTSVLKPYGVWVVISPFNFPSALTGGPVGAALVAGNTVVIKPASNTVWTPSLLVECFRQAGIPDGVINFVTGPGSTVGNALVESKDIDGITFTGSYEVGMDIYRRFAQGAYVRPVILELGGKNPTIVSKHADLDDAAIGIARSAFGLQGQKCSACSRVFVETEAYAALVERLAALTEKLKVGDPTERDTYMGPVIDQASYDDFKTFTAELKAAGKIVAGGEVLSEGALAKGYFCQPTVVADVPLDHRLWKHEMFLPIVMVHPVKDLHEAMLLANDIGYGLTAGFYGTETEVGWFYDHIQAGVVYANRPLGSTTGAWPGYQPFGGWKGSGASGKNAGGLYYLPLYMREQIQNQVRRP
ncbi:MAG: aldehyde dehydrogenase family protein [Chloroflexi bacterium]|nr:aldehyde dehydrogenase family protein [Chloroflexota bacterium]